MAIEHRSVSRCRRPFVNRATSYNLKHLPTGDKEDFTQYEQMISIEEYSFAVILYYRTLPKHSGIAAAEIGPPAIGVSRLQEIETIDPGT
ncbi:hypothetical protein ELI25_26340 (plasmid) [Rhizobium ruizarguesonis]|nr:hypothetical protein ELI25_26340 [Rhizobium ruizarguesonis]TAZ47852.1 hypothetical protein ELH76_28205 [Rhizobium ruizarguesonis]